jgi:tetratricopeptide (TPR) repeat protein
MKITRLIALSAIALIATNLNVQSVNAGVRSFENVNYQNLSQSNKDIRAVKADIAELLKDKIDIFDKSNQLSDTPKDIEVLDDGIKFRIKVQHTVLYFADIIDYVIPPPYFRKSKSVLSLEKFEFLSKGFNSDLKRLENLRQNLILIQNELKVKREESKRILFEQKAAEYRASKVKPVVSEEQRKFIVQANAFNQQKNYAKAIELYFKAIEVDPTAYPAGYSNLALLMSQTNNFSAAIINMKKYLLLEPEATDSRTAQDKIYEWEAMIQK